MITQSIVPFFLREILSSMNGHQGPLVDVSVRVTIVTSVQHNNEYSQFSSDITLSLLLLLLLLLPLLPLLLLTLSLSLVPSAIILVLPLTRKKTSSLEMRYGRFEEEGEGGGQYDEMLHSNERPSCLSSPSTFFWVEVSRVQRSWMCSLSIHTVVILFLKYGILDAVECGYFNMNLWYSR